MPDQTVPDLVTVDGRRRLRGFRSVIAFCGLPAAAAVVGFGAWFFEPGCLALAALVPALWASGRSRVHGALTVLAYQLAATSSAPASIAHYYGSVIGLGALLWSAGGAVIAATWLIFWHHDKRRRAAIALAPLAITAFPPVGIVGWVHPICAAGALFPHTAWLGIASTAALIVATASVRATVLPIAAAVFLIRGITLEEPVAAPPGWVGVNTHASHARGDLDLLADFERQVRTIDRAQETAADVIVFPESTGGLWTAAADSLWSQRYHANRLIFLGAQILHSDGSATNGLIRFENGKGSLEYAQRMPVPLSMWRPWSTTGTRAYWFRNPIVDVRGRRVAFFICYEELLPWTAFHSLAAGPDLIVGCGNDWWCAGSAIPNIQRNTLWSWARLFDLPLVTAVNL